MRVIPARSDRRLRPATGAFPVALVLALALACLGPGAAIGFGADVVANANTRQDRVATDRGDLVVHPINHATFLLEWNGKTFCVDPVGGATRFAGKPRPDAILLTDIHGDHLDLATLASLVTPDTLLVAPAAVAEKLGADLRAHLTVLGNGATGLVAGVAIEALPMYNTTPERRNYHAKGRGNGYLLTFGNRRVYVSGDTEDIPEMRALKDIDVAFLCMNLPYTMTIDQAAAAVAAFRPRIVYPYHSKGSDLKRFKDLAAKTPGVDVRLLDWYP
jgi:L-ascorbate metabolism protein UlaG (beta-lactamase superfamily)